VADLLSSISSDLHSIGRNAFVFLIMLAAAFVIINMITAAVGPMVPGIVIGMTIGGFIVHLYYKRRNTP